MVDLNVLVESVVNLLATQAATSAADSVYDAARDRLRQFTEFLRRKLGRDVDPTALAQGHGSDQHANDLRSSLLEALELDPEFARDLKAYVDRLTSDPAVVSFVTNVLPGAEVGKVVNIAEAGHIDIA